MLDKVLDYLAVQVVAIVPEHCHSTSIHVPIVTCTRERDIRITPLQRCGGS